MSVADDDFWISSYRSCAFTLYASITAFHASFDMDNEEGGGGALSTDAVLSCNTRGDDLVPNGSQMLVMSKSLIN